MRKLKTVIMIVCMIMIMQIHTLAAAIPTLDMPFVPPMEVEIYDTLFNASGVTAVEESDEQKRLNAYIDLFTKALGMGAESFLQDMQSIVQNAKANRQITLDSDTAAKLQQAVKYAMETGYDVADGEEIEYTRADVLNKINIHAHEMYGSSNMSTQSISGIVDYLYQGGGLMFYVAGNYHFVSAGDFSNVTDTSFYAIYTRTNIWHDGYWTWTNQFNTQFNVDYVEYYPTTDSFMQAGAKKKVLAKDATTQAAITAGTNTIITPASQLTETGKVDITKPIVINIYKTISYPATTTQDIDEKQRELVVNNISSEIDGTQERTELQELAIAQYGNIQDYHLSLLDFFPFCIPKDIMLILHGFDADPVAPSITIPFPTWEDGELTHYDLYVSLEQFDSLAALMRRLECVVFLVGLLVVTRERYLRG